MTIKERKQKLEEAERLMRALGDILRELEDNKPEKYDWNDLDYPLQYMQDDICSVRYKIFPSRDYSMLDYIHSAQRHLSEFETKRDLFNSTKIPED